MELYRVLYTGIPQMVSSPRCHIQKIHPGDIVWIPPGEKHWHGAASTTAMTHIAIQEQLDGKTVDWMEKVSDEQYQLDC
jgi:mannose-6-phosphate isomerase-like protein (cupin superfamily)